MKNKIRDKIMDIILLTLFVIFIGLIAVPFKPNDLDIQVTPICNDKCQLLNIVNDMPSFEYRLGRYDCKQASSSLAREIKTKLGYDSKCAVGLYGKLAHMWLEVNMNGTIVSIEATACDNYSCHAEEITNFSNYKKQNEVFCKW